MEESLFWISILYNQLNVIQSSNYEHLLLTLMNNRFEIHIFNLFVANEF